jgi:hypothetical protein
MFEQLNATQQQALRELDQAVYTGSTVTIETPFGDVGVRSCGTLGFAADLDPESEFPEYSANGATPTIAFLNLREKMRKMRSNVIAFPAPTNEQPAFDKAA